MRLMRQRALREPRLSGFDPCLRLFHGNLAPRPVNRAEATQF